MVPEVTSGDDIDTARISAAVREILLAVGEDPDREGLDRTPDRVARTCAELFDGVGKRPVELLNTFVEPSAGGFVSLRGIEFGSVCEHNLLPFYGVVNVGYLPGPDRRITGWGGLVRMVEAFAHRPQVQERLTENIADAMVSALAPRGVVVAIRAEHLCMSLVGVRQPSVRAVTRATRGCFESEPERWSDVLNSVIGE